MDYVPGQELWLGAEPTPQRVIYKWKTAAGARVRTECGTEATVPFAELRPIEPVGGGQAEAKVRAQLKRDVAKRSTGERQAAMAEGLQAVELKGLGKAETRAKGLWTALAPDKGKPSDPPPPVRFELEATAGGHRTLLKVNDPLRIEKAIRLLVAQHAGTTFTLAVRVA